MTYSEPRLTREFCDLGDGAKLLEANLRLLEDPHALYKGGSNEIRRKLNQAIFVANE